ncbi:MAG: sigma 54-interacting transcriptional regulator [Thermotogae bacterium]|nr:sigma 54-interacting transcriptional regulator [Thermotogota bacterium]
MRGIVFILPNENLVNLARKFMYERGITDVSVFQGDLNAAVEIAEQLTDVEVVISRGGTAELLEQHAKGRFSVVRIKVHALDILRELRKVVQKAHNILLAGFESIFEEIYPELETLSTLLGVSLKLANLYENPDFLLSLDRSTVVVGDTVNVSIAASAGFETALIESSVYSIAEAYERAEEVLQAKLQERKREYAFMRTINALNVGVLYLSREEVFVNHFANHHMMPELKEYIQVEKKVRRQKAKVKIRGVKYEVDIIPVFFDNEAADILAIASPVPDKSGKLYSSFKSKYKFDDIIAVSTKMLQIKEKARKYAKSDANVFIFGETGTGKELFAHSIHSESSRSDENFVALNCASLPAELLESELFGYVRGAFTGASSEGKKGLLEVADGGTIFLDEIDQMPMEVQGKLLRAIEQQEIIKLGDTRLIPIDVRIITASGKSKSELMASKSFRKDLLMRLDVLELELPPLRERPEDIPVLAKHYLQAFCEKYGLPQVGFSERAKRELLSYHWPGNVRELMNVIERTLLQIPDGTRAIDSFGVGQVEVMPSVPVTSQTTPLANEIERAVAELLKSRGLSLDVISQILGVSRTTLWRRLRNHY